MEKESNNQSNNEMFNKEIENLEKNVLNLQKQHVMLKYLTDGYDAIQNMTIQLEIKLSDVETMIQSLEEIDKSSSEEKS